MADFQPWPKIARLFRDCVITEKLDGTNAAIAVRPLDQVPHWQLDPPVLFAPDALQCVVVGDWVVHAQSRSRVITPEFDNFGFATWVRENAIDLANTLGEGVHFGEWWGRGIQRGYDQTTKRFSLFNTKRWADVNSPLVDAVPVIYSGPFSEHSVMKSLTILERGGSFAAPGFMDPEGVVVYHSASNQMFKVTLKNDGHPKGQAA